MNLCSVKFLLSFLIFAAQVVVGAEYRGLVNLDDYRMRNPSYAPPVAQWTTQSFYPSQMTQANHSGGVNPGTVALALGYYNSALSQPYTNPMTCPPCAQPMHSVYGGRRPDFSGEHRAVHQVNLSNRAMFGSAVQPASFQPVPYAARNQGNFTGKREQVEVRFLTPVGNVEGGLSPVVEKVVIAYAHAANVWYDLNAKHPVAGIRLSGIRRDAGYLQGLWRKERGKTGVSMVVPQGVTTKAYDMPGEERPVFGQEQALLAQKVIGVAYHMTDGAWLRLDYNPGERVWLLLRLAGEQSKSAAQSQVQPATNLSSVEDWNRL